MMVVSVIRSLTLPNSALGFPAPQQHLLGNGCPITYLPVADASVVCIEFWCQAGSAMEQNTESGIAHFLEHMVFKGNENLPPGAFDLQIESIGGSSNAATGFDEVQYHLVIPPEGLALACDLLPQLVLQPGLERESFQMERLVVLEELSQSEDQPEEVAFQRLLHLACGNHPYGRPIIGLRSDLLNHGPADMQRFQSRHYKAANCAVAVGGCFASDELLKMLAAGPIAELDAEQDPALIDLNPDDLHMHWQPGEHHLSLPRLESARLLIAWSAPFAADPEALMGVDLWAAALAEGRSSRLVKVLREKLQLVESIDVEVHPLERGSLVILEAVTNPESLPKVRQELEKLLTQAQQGFELQEIERAKRLIGNGYTFSHEAISQVTHHLGQASLQKRLLPLDAPLQWLKQWDQDRLHSLAKNWDLSKACILEVLPE